LMVALFAQRVAAFGVAPCSCVALCSCVGASPLAADVTHHAQEVLAQDLFDRALGQSALL